MAQQVNVPYFTVNQYGQLTKAGQVTLSIPDGTVSWSDIIGKPDEFPPSAHPDTPLATTGAGFSLINNATTNTLKGIVGGGDTKILDIGTSLIISTPSPINAFLLIGA